MEEEFKNDSVFLKKFKGLYITPAAGSTQDAAVYAADLSLSGLELYMRIHDSLDVQAIYDTTFCSFLFRDSDDNSSSSGYSISWNNVSINTVDFEYEAGSALGDLETATNGFTDTLETDTTQPLVFVQSMGGVAGYLRFTEGMLNTLRNLQVKDNAEYDILINQAMMYVWIDRGEDMIAAMDNSIERLGSYTNLKTLTPIPDYMYSYEMQLRAQEETKDYILPYKGFLNRSNGYYEFDITSFVQQLAKEPEEPDNAPDPTIKLAPEAYKMFQFGQSVLQGDGSENPIKIRLTYTLIEKP
jgi:hypothetical protein